MPGGVDNWAAKGISKHCGNRKEKNLEKPWKRVSSVSGQSEKPNQGLPNKDKDKLRKENSGVTTQVVRPQRKTHLKETQGHHPKLGPETAVGYRTDLS